MSNGIGPGDWVSEIEESIKMPDETTMSGKQEFMAEIATGAVAYFAQREAASPQYQDALRAAREETYRAGETQFLVTVKLPRNPKHDPKNKVSGLCPLSGKTCTDVTGEHHSEIIHETNIDNVRASYRSAGFHVTRIEQI